MTVFTQQYPYTSWNSATLDDYWTLLKPRVMTLVIFTGWVGLIRAPETIHPFWALFALLCIAIGAGASGALNMWYERHTDALMKRTHHRPLPQKRVCPNDALTLGLMLSIASVSMLGLVIGWIPGTLLLFTIFFYSVIYTMCLKPHTPYNIVWGGLAGALPPVIGWSCAGSITSLEPWLLCIIIFLWTPPHFWALALLYQEDYQAAGLPMMPQIKGAKHTYVQMRLYTVYTALAVGVLAFQPSVSRAFGIISTAYSFWFIWRIWHLDPFDRMHLKGFFKDSIHYLFALFSLLALDHML